MTAKKDPRQTEIPGTEGTAEQQALAALTRHASTRVEEIFGPCPACLSAHWYQRLKQQVEEEILDTFRKGLKLGAKLE